METAGRTTGNMFKLRRFVYTTLGVACEMLHIEAAVTNGHHLLYAYY